MSVRVAGAWASVLLFAACSSSHPQTGPSTSSSTTRRVATSTAPPTSASGAPTSTATPPATCATGSSPPGYDATNGKYAVHLTSIDGTGRTIGFDPIQFLVGDDAVAAWRRDNPGATGGPPNDYYIVNASTRSYEARASTDVVVWQVRLEETSTAELKGGTFAGLVAYLGAHKTGSSLLSDRPYWITLRNGLVTTICEQYVP